LSTPAITALILTFNEAPNLARTLARLRWAREVVVFDSFSTDETPSAVRNISNGRLVQRPFDTHVAQWNAGIVECGTDWVLALDADYVLSPELVEELRAWRPEPGIDAYFCRFRYCIDGRPLRGSLYPPRAVLFHRGRCRYLQDGHTQLLQTPGNVAWLRHVIFHDDRKPISHWIAAQDRYARLELEKLQSTPVSALGLQDRVRRYIVLAPVLVFLYTLIWKCLILDGWRGWFYVCQRTVAELILSLRLTEAKLRDNRED
jgi:glycosyltransferase involved in cell wall biosynthesis